MLLHVVLSGIATSKYSVTFSMPVCKLAFWSWPNVEATCSKLPFVVAVMPALVLSIPVVVFRQYLKMPYWNFIRHFRLGLGGEYSTIRLGQPDYQYETLQPGFIRVLDVLPRDPSLGPYIIAKMRHVQLEDAKYDAISYTWGNPIKSKGILINGKWFSVTENAFGVIEDRVSLLHKRTIWIDCICINQEDDQEKSQQVVMMDEIYRKANRAILWLGDIPDGIMAFSLVEDLCRRVKREKAGEGKKYELQLNNATRIWLLEFYNKFDPRFSALARILGHPYFCRLWIIQEITFSKEVHMRCGTCWLNWPEFEWAVFLLLSSKYRRLVGSDNVLWSMQRAAVLSQIQQISSFRHKLKDNDASARLPLGSILADTSIADATDKRDLVYGLLSMSKAAEDAKLVPNYTIDTTQVFKNTAKYLLVNSELEDVLYGAGVGYPRETAEIPSWIPDWACQPRVNRLRKKGVFTYNASNGRSQSIQTPDTDSILMRGISFDQISILSSRCLSPENPNMHSSGWKDIAVEILFLETETRELTERLPDIYLNGHQSRQEALWRTKLGDRSRKIEKIKPGIFSDNPNPTETEDEKGTFDRPAPLERWIQALRMYEQVVSGMKVAGLTSQLFLAADGQYSADIALVRLKELIRPMNAEQLKALGAIINELRDYFEAMCLTSAGRKFAITEKGYMALVPPLSQVGDKVCILFNMDVPFILRQVPESVSMHYQIVGESYVHGIMDGEACEDESVEVNFRIV
jgi:hypothetical protein